MKVKKLIELLVKENPEAEVLTSYNGEISHIEVLNDDLCITKNFEQVEYLSNIEYSELSNWTLMWEKGCIVIH